MNKKFDSIVIGAGPGGYVCAIRLAQLGKKTAIIEKEKLGGVCLNIGCIPSKALIHAANEYWKINHEALELGISVSSSKVDFSKLISWKDSVVKKLTTGVGQLLKANGVEIITGTAEIKNKKVIVNSTEYEANNIVIASGSRTFEIPSLPFNGKTIISSTEALSLKEIPKKMIVVGGGFIGLEIGMAYAKLGSKITIIEALDKLLTTVDQELVTTVEKKMKQLGIEVFKQTQAQSYKEKNNEIELITNKGSFSANIVMVSVGRKPNSADFKNVGFQMDPKGHILVDRTGKTSIDGIYAIGDVTGAPQLAHKASMDGLLVAETISGKKAYKDYKVIPWAVFTDPEIAVCGLTEEEAKKEGFEITVGRFPFAASGRALSTQNTEGLIKTILDQKTKAILGVHMVGADVSNLIAQAATAIEMGSTYDDLVRTIHTHPTLPEAFLESVEAAFGHAIHIYKPKRK